MSSQAVGKELTTQSATVLAPGGAVMCSGQLATGPLGGAPLTGNGASIPPGQKFPAGQSSQLLPKDPAGQTQAETAVDPAGLVLLPGQPLHCDRLILCVTTRAIVAIDVLEVVSGPGWYVPGGHA